MKTARISLAVVTGLLLGFGFAAGATHERLSPPKIVVGLLLGFFSAFNIIRHPEQLTKARLYITAILLLVLVVYKSATDSPMEAIVTVVMSCAFMGVMIASASLPVDEGKDSASDAAQ